MNFRSNIKYIWLALAAPALVLTALLRFGFESDNLLYSVLALNALMCLLSVPCSLFFIPVATAAGYCLEIGTFSATGAYLNTVFLFVLGFMQWFWIARFWSPAGPPFQKLDLIDG